MTASVAAPIEQISKYSPSRILHDRGEQYVLPVDEEEHERLLMQHRLIKETAGGKVFFPPYDNSKSYFILDVGVGPAGWLKDVAAIMSPTSILHGVDLSSRQFPKIHPENMSFSACSVLSLPDTWEKSFDFVHQRLLVGALKSFEWPIAMKQLFKVLKPGGWAQVCESGPWLFPTGPDSALVRHRKLNRAYFESRDLNWDIYKKLPGLLSDAGFVNVTVEVLHAPIGAKAGPTGAGFLHDVVNFYKAMKEQILSAGGFGIVSSEAEYDKLTEDFAREGEEVEGAIVEFYVICAQRPHIA